MGGAPEAEGAPRARGQRGTGLTVAPAFTNDLALKREAFDALGTLAEQGLVTRVSLTMYDTRGPFPYEVFSSIAGATGEIHRAMQWWVGDLLNQAEIAHGDEYGQIAAETGMSERTLINRKSVAKRVTAERRMPGVSFSCHDLVAALTPAQQKKWLKKAAEGLWTREIMREQLRSSQGIEIVQISKGELREMCHQILEHAAPFEDGENAGFLVPNEDIERLRYALGEPTPED